MTISNDYRGKVVLITGGGKGIGRETARRFHDAGAKIAITGRDKAALEKTAAELAGNDPESVLTVTADVSLESDCRRTVDTVLERLGRVDVLINNAGMSARGIFSETSISLYTSLVGINFLGPVMMSRLLVEEITRNSGSIVFISTLAALKGLPGLSHYGSSKIPLTIFSESLRGELREAGVHVGIVYVGFTENDSGKTIYDAQGVKIPLSDRKNSLTQGQVAGSVFNLVEKRRPIITLSLVGKLAAFFYRILPRFSERLTAYGTMRSSRY